MYAGCLFCPGDLGRNAVVEAFPVGRRLAFDARRGRLWVVCPHCARWNLTPLDERWEAIEACERLFRGTRLRASTENVGLARLAEGLELVRIGDPLRPEFAAWRYGDRLGRRHRRRQLVVGGGALAALGAAFAGGAVVGGAALAGVVAIQVALWRVLGGRGPLEVIAPRTGPGPEGPAVLAVDVARVRVWGDGEALCVELAHAACHGGSVSLRGAEAEHVVGRLTPYVNRAGALGEEVADAVTLIDGAGDPSAFLARFSERADADSHSWAHAIFLGGHARRGLAALPSPARLALEMATHEAEERRALEGELTGLAHAWRGAEEIASIADGLAVPPALEVAARRLAGETPG